MNTRINRYIYTHINRIDVGRMKGLDWWKNEVDGCTG